MEQIILTDDWRRIDPGDDSIVDAVNGSDFEVEFAPDDAILVAFGDPRGAAIPTHRLSQIPPRFALAPGCELWARTDEIAAAIRVVPFLGGGVQ